MWSLRCVMLITTELFHIAKKKSLQLSWGINCVFYSMRCIKNQYWRVLYFKLHLISSETQGKYPFWELKGHNYTFDPLGDWLNIWVWNHHSTVMAALTSHEANTSIQIAAKAFPGSVCFLRLLQLSLEIPASCRLTVSNVSQSHVTLTCREILHVIDGWKVFHCPHFLHLMCIFSFWDAEPHKVKLEHSDGGRERKKLRFMWVNRKKDHSFEEEMSKSHF